MTESDLESVILHLDLDAFFASVEQLDNPELAGKPVIVGARPGERGVVAACSYEARAYGIHSAMPISEAVRLCPQAAFLPLRFERYLELSAKIMDFLKGQAPGFIQLSIDEAFLDLSGTKRVLGDPVQFARLLRQEITKQFGLKITIGIASNPYLAKLASRKAKPDGLLQIKHGEELAFLDQFSPARLWGVGKKTAALLKGFNITTMEKLRSFSLGVLQSILGKACANFLYAACRGQDPCFSTEKISKPSLSHETTFPRDLRDLFEIQRTLLLLSHQVFFRMIASGQKSKTVTLKLRLASFETLTAQKTSEHYLSSAEEVYAIGLKLLLKKWNQKTPLRLLGVGLTSLIPEEEFYQPELFDDGHAALRKQRLQEAILRIRSRFKNEAITKARLLAKNQSDLM